MSESTGRSFSIAPEKIVPKVQSMGGGSDLKRLSGNQNLLLGMVSGCGCKMLNYPLLAWKDATQQGLKIEFSVQGLPRTSHGYDEFGWYDCSTILGNRFFSAVTLRGRSTEVTNSIKLQASFWVALSQAYHAACGNLTMIQQQRFGGSIPELLYA